jgi:uncharacterized protein YaaR (DUF327 family)
MLDYAKKLDKRTSKIKFGKLLPKNSPEFVEILDNFLLVNPYFRSSASESLKWKVFRDVRNKSKEASAPGKLKLLVDRNDAFDYEKCESTRFDLSAYKKIIKETVIAVH